MSADTLADLLGNLPEYELLGVELLRQHTPAPGAIVPAPELSVYAQATIQMIRYRRDCTNIHEQIRKLPPTPLSISIPEYGL